MPRKRNILPGFGLTAGLTVVYLSLIVLIPLSFLFLKASALSWEEFCRIVLAPRAVMSYRLTFLTSLAGALINLIFGFVVAWVLARYSFPGKKIVDALIDLPFAIPTAVAGICLTAIYSPNSWLGHWFLGMGIKTAFSPLGIIIALTFVGLPFVVRSVQPVLEDLDLETEEAAASLGANRWQTFTRVVLPMIFPAMLTGFTLAFARSLGEYGSVIFIAGNMPMKTEIISLLIMTKLEQFDYTGASAIAIVMLVASFVLLILISLLQSWGRRRYHVI